MSAAPAFEVDSDGKTVWVNSGKTGTCLGRFSYLGIDIHHDSEEQQLHGKQCLDCKKGPCTLEDWVHFVDGMKEHYGVVIHGRHMPRFLSVLEFA